MSVFGRIERLFALAKDFCLNGSADW